MPGVLLIEAMAQTSGWLLIALTKFERMPFLAAVKEAKMRRFVKPGDLLMIEAKLVHEGSGLRDDGDQNPRWRRIEDAMPRSPSALSPFPNPELRVHMEAMAKRIGFPQQAIAHD